MTGRGQPWAIIHGAEERAGTDAERLRSKLDDPLVFERVYDRMVRIVGAEHVLIAASHRLRETWAEVLADIPDHNIIDHPYERGLPAAILLPFLHIFRREPSARVLVVPADQIISEEDIFERALLEALDATPGPDNRAVLLGMKPRTIADPGHLLFLSERTVGRTCELLQIEPARDPEVRELLEQNGALINSMIFAAGTSAMLRLYDQTLPGLFRSFISQLRGSDAWTPEVISALYRFLPHAELLKDLLRPGADLLRVLPVDECGYVHLESLVESEELSSVAPSWPTTARVEPIAL